MRLIKVEFEFVGTVTVELGEFVIVMCTFEQLKIQKVLAFLNGPNSIELLRSIIFSKNFSSKIFGQCNSFELLKKNFRGKIGLAP